MFDILKSILNIFKASDLNNARKLGNLLNYAPYIINNKPNTRSAVIEPHDISVMMSLWEIVQELGNDATFGDANDMITEVMGRDYVLVPPEGMAEDKFRSMPLLDRDMDLDDRVDYRSEIGKSITQPSILRRVVNFFKEGKGGGRYSVPLSEQMLGRKPSDYISTLRHRGYGNEQIGNVMGILNEHRELLGQLANKRFLPKERVEELDDMSDKLANELDQDTYEFGPRKNRDVLGVYSRDWEKPPIPPFETSTPPNSPESYVGDEDISKSLSKSLSGNIEYRTTNSGGLIMYKNVNNLTKSVTKSILAQGYDITDDAIGFISNVVMSTIKKSAESAYGKYASKADIERHVEEKFDRIKNIVLSTVESKIDADMLHKANSDLTYHPVHALAHKIEDEDGELWEPDMMVKGFKYNELPSELREHLENYHGENAVYHVHIDDDSMYQKSADNTHSMYPEFHEFLHRMDEKAYLEINHDVTLPSEEWQLDMYHEFCVTKSNMIPGDLMPDETLVSHDLAAHYVQNHGINEHGEMDYNVHPLEVPMIGKSAIYESIQVNEKDPNLTLVDRVRSKISRDERLSKGGKTRFDWQLSGNELKLVDNVTGKHGTIVGKDALEFESKLVKSSNSTIGKYWATDIMIGEMFGELPPEFKKAIEGGETPAMTPDGDMEPMEKAEDDSFDYVTFAMENLGVSEDVARVLDKNARRRYYDRHQIEPHVTADPVQNAKDKTAMIRSILETAKEQSRLYGEPDNWDIVRDDRERREEAARAREREARREEAAGAKEMEARRDTANHQIDDVIAGDEDRDVDSRWIPQVGDPPVDTTQLKLDRDYEESNW